jgi:murein DD-endopeptidase MepM/ murein hydrolase activator NlpD
VARGDSVYLIARRNSVPIRAIIEANHLEPPYLLQPGQTLIVPHPQVHVVQPGDTLLTVARQHGVVSSELVRVNDLKPPYRLLVGQTLILPGEAAGEQPVAQPAAQAEVQRVELLPPPPAGSSSTAAATPPQEPKAAAVGKVEPATPPTPPLPQAPPNAPSGSAEANAVAPPMPVPAQPPPATAQDVASGDGAPIKPPAPAGAQVAALPPSEPPTAPAIVDKGGRFAWPVRGKIISGFGAKDGGLFNDGINIAVKEGEPVVAADSGVVAYAGNEIRGFGNLVLIKHPNGWMTAYAHNEAILVKRGEEVRRGQTIAKAGASGGVASPQVHFEIRHGSRAVDPAKYLAAVSS